MKQGLCEKKKQLTSEEEEEEQQPQEQEAQQEPNKDGTNFEQPPPSNMLELCPRSCNVCNQSPSRKEGQEGQEGQNEQERTQSSVVFTSPSARKVRRKVLLLCVLHVFITLVSLLFLF